MYFLNWKGFGMLRRKALENLKPDVIIVVNGTKVKITSVTSVKSAIEEYELDEPATYDPGSGTAETFINSVEVKWQKRSFWICGASVAPRNEEFQKYFTKIINLVLC